MAILNLLSWTRRSKQVLLHLMWSCIAMVAVMLLGGCVTALDPQTSPHVVVFPLQDIRTNKSVKLVVNVAMPVTPQDLARQGRCIGICAAAQGLPMNFTVADVQTGNTSKLKAIPTRGERYALLFVLSQWEFASSLVSFKYELTAYLIDTKTGAVAWSNRASGSHWEGLIQGPLDKAFGSPTDFYVSAIVSESLKGLVVPST